MRAMAVGAFSVMSLVLACDPGEPAPPPPVLEDRQQGDLCAAGVHDGAVCLTPQMLNTVAASCAAGTCALTCAPHPEFSRAFQDCDGDRGNGCEVDTFEDAKNCGSCGTVCPAAAPDCVQAVCVCASRNCS